MSLLSSLAKGVLNIGKSFLGLPAKAPKVVQQVIRPVTAGLPALPKIGSAGGGGGRILPGLGAIGGSAAGSVAGAIAGSMGSRQQKQTRRRRKGISARDLMSFKRVARLVDKFSKPVGKMRNYRPKKEF